MLLRACPHRLNSWPGARRSFAKMAQRVVDPFKVLGVPPTATLEEAQRAFHDKAMQNHPDSNHGSEAHERMQAVNVAWDSVRAAILARVDTPEPRTTAAARQQRQPSQERDAASRRAAELVAAAEQRMAAERKAVDQAKFKEALAKDKANKAKAKMAREKLKQSKAEAAKDAKDAKAKRVAEAAVAARLAELEREAVLIENASDDVQAKVAAKRGWLAYYAHLWLIRSLREEALSAPPLSAFRKTYLSLIAAFEDDLCTDRDIFYLAALNTGGRAGRAIFGIPFHWNVQVVQGPGRPGPS